MIRQLLVTALTLPAFVLHELLHCFAAAPWAQRVGVGIDLDVGQPRALIEWRDEETAPKAVAALAPAVVGSLLFLCGVGWWLRAGRPMPSGVTQSAATVIGLVWWLILTTPSSEDLSYLGGRASQPATSGQLTEDD